MTPALTVNVTFQGRGQSRITIGFLNHGRALQYFTSIRQTPIHETENLDSQLMQCDVSLRLPSRISGITASKTIGGFYFDFEDQYLAQKWVNELLIWKFVGSSRTSIYVDRYMEPQELGQRLSNGAITIPVREPGPARRQMREAAYEDG